MKTALVAMVLALFTAASVVSANEVTAPQGAKVAKKHKKHNKKEEKKSEATAPAEGAPAENPAAAPAPEGEKK